MPNLVKVFSDPPYLWESFDPRADLRFQIASKQNLANEK